jgi:uncharacterized protein YjbI with pentapeptide repeats
MTNASLNGASLLGARLNNARLKDNVIDDTKARFQVTKQSLDNLKAVGLPRAILEQLSRIEGQEFRGEKNFLLTLESKLGEASAVRLSIREK